MALSELNCLHQGWPKPLFVFMSRYQHDLERMRKDCKERFGCTHSGNCTHCGKLIQQNLAMSGYVVHSVERDGSRLCRSSTKDS